MNQLPYDLANAAALIALTAGVYLLHGLGWALVAAGCQVYAVNWTTARLVRGAGD